MSDAAFQDVVRRLKICNSSWDVLKRDHDRMKFENAELKDLLTAKDATIASQTEEIETLRKTAERLRKRGTDA